MIVCERDKSAEACRYLNICTAGPIHNMYRTVTDSFTQAICDELSRLGKGGIFMYIKAQLKKIP